MSTSTQIVGNTSKALSKKPESEMGLFLRGLIMAKNSYLGGKTPRYTLDIAAPGNRQNVPVQVPEEYYSKAQEMMPFNEQISVSQFAGNLNFTLI